jgi:hypothetical protein
MRTGIAFVNKLGKATTTHYVNISVIIRPNSRVTLHYFGGLLLVGSPRENSTGTKILA